MSTTVAALLQGGWEPILELTETSIIGARLSFTLYERQGEALIFRTYILSDDTIAWIFYFPLKMGRISGDRKIKRPFPPPVAPAARGSPAPQDSGRTGRGTGACAGRGWPALAGRGNNGYAAARRDHRRLDAVGRTHAQGGGGAGV